MRKRGKRKTQSRKRYKARRRPWPTVMQQRHYDIIGLGLVATGVYFSLVFYMAWDGGKVGDALAQAFVYMFGQVAYLAPLAIFSAGALMVLRPFVPSLAPFKFGAICLFGALMLGLSAQAFGLGPGHPVRGSVFYEPYLTSHGGFVGEVLYRATSALFQRAGSILISVFLLLTGLLLLTGASIAGIMRSTTTFFGDAAAKARLNTQEFVERLSLRLKQTETDETFGEGFDQALDQNHGAVLLEGGSHEDDQTAETLIASDGDRDHTALSGVDRGEHSHGQTVPPAPGQAYREDELTPMGNRRSGVTEAVGRDYVLPAPSILKRSSVKATPDISNRGEIAKGLVEVLGHFNVEAEVIGMVSGPHVTRYELRLAPGTKVAKVSQLKDDIAYALASTEIRILAPIPGKQAVGVEVPNRRRRIVTLGDIMQTAKRQGPGQGLPVDASPLTVWLGKDVAGKAIWTDLAKMPHLLVAGTTGSGKSGCINTMLSSILLRATPDQVRMVLIDPKQVELNYYESIPHLLAPLVTVPRLAANALGNLVKEMEARYGVMSEARSRNLVEFNRYRIKHGERPLPYIVCVVDELADMMMIAPAEVEDAIIRLAQKSRAVGIHLALATQRPSTDIITGTIKVNVPARIAFSVSSQVDSRVILDQGGAETLLGQGDMLFRSAGSSKLQRIQGAFVTEDEVARLASFWSKQGEPELDEQLLNTVAAPEQDDQLSPDEDDLLEEAISLVAQTRTASVSMLQRRLRVGYTRAGRLIDMLERRGIISGYEGSKPRQVLIQEGELARILSERSTPPNADAEEIAEHERVAAGAEGAH